MKLEEIKDIEKRTLVRLEDGLKEDKIPAKLIFADEDFPYDLLELIVYDIGANHEEVIGDVSFVNIDAENEIHTFTCVTTLHDNLKEENMSKLFEAVSDLNYYLPYGAFSVSRKDKTLVYKLSAPLTTDLNEDQLYDETQVIISNAFLVVDRYIDLLMDVNEGKAVDLIREITGQE